MGPVDLANGTTKITATRASTGQVIGAEETGAAPSFGSGVPSTGLMEVIETASGPILVASGSAMTGVQS